MTEIRKPLLPPSARELSADWRRRFMIDNAAKVRAEITKGSYDEILKSNLSLMPANVAEILNELEFMDLVSYLMSQRQKDEPQ